MRKVLSWIMVMAIILNLGGVAAFAESEPAKSEPAKASAEAEPTKPAETPKDKVLSKEALEKLVKLIKAKISIPDSYTRFSSEMNSYEDKMLYYFRWQPDSTDYSAAGGTVEVMADEQGIIQSYSRYEYSRNYDYKRRLPKASREEAIGKAKKFIYFMAPDIAGQLSFEPEDLTCTVNNDGNYSMNFYRYYKKIPFYDNHIFISMNGATGEIIEFRRTWNEKFQFPDPEKAMDVQKAKEFFEKGIGLELKYRRTYGQEEDRTYLEYSLPVSDANNCIDAFSGEKVTENQRDDAYNDERMKYEIYLKEQEQTFRDVNLTEQELEELKKVQGLMSVEEAEKLIRGSEALGIDSTYKMNTYSYNTYQGKDTQYMLQLNFTKSISVDDLEKDIPKEKLNVMIAAGELGGNVFIAFNAKTKELISVNSYGNYGFKGEKAAYGREALKKAAEDFLAKYKGEKYREIKFADAAGSYAARYGMPYYGDDSSFVYFRQVNGIGFEDNQIVLSFDPGTGKLRYYRENWDDMTFAPTSKAMGKDKALEALYKQNQLKKRYITARPSGEVRLVYGFSIGKPISIDAEKGYLINYYNGEAYKEKGAANYKDIEGHPAKEQIQTLAQLGILPQADNYHPDSAMTQKDWMYIIGKVKGNYYTEAVTTTLNQKEMDGMYRSMINEGVLEEMDKDPDATVTREKALMYLLNAAGYKKFAELEGIFNCGFADKNKIDTKLIGYAAIAKSMKIVSGNNGYLRPKDGLTRAEGAIMIYNYMKY